MVEDRIEINGMVFVADRLLPNYQGVYTCTCEECFFDKDDIDFGGINPCMLVKCIQNNRLSGNHNVWRAEDVRQIKWKED